MTKEQQKARLEAILAMPENTAKVLWGHVVMRGNGFSWQLDNVKAKSMGPIETANNLK